MHPKKAFFQDSDVHMSRIHLHNWYAENKRPLPWRDHPAPYETWLCEIIMQQTRIAQGTAYWERFTRRWPNFEALAHASLDEVLKEWQGLGYYSRARNLHKTAKIIHSEYPTGYPTEFEQWLTLPGIGQYTAAAICSICFESPVAAIDGNVLRVLSRFLGIYEPVDKPAGRKPIDTFAKEWVPEERPGLHNQALMELGALICTPKKPACDACPLQTDCACRFGFESSDPMPPIKAGKTKVIDIDLHFHIIIQDGLILMNQRPEKGIWGGLWSFPTSESPSGMVANDVVPEGIHPNLMHLGPCGPEIKHLLSHRRLNVRFWLWQCADKINIPSGFWHTWESAEALALPRVLESSWEDVKNSVVQKLPKTRA